VVLLLVSHLLASYQWNRLLPANLYGPGDNFDPSTSHVIPALIRKFVEATARDEPLVEVWGTGQPSREFLYVDDCARAVVLAADRYESPDPVNVGTGTEITIADLAKVIADATGFRGTIAFDPTRPDGQPRRSLDVSRAEAAFGFRASVGLREGVAKTVEWWIGHS